MGNTKEWLRNIFAVLGIFTLGYWLAGAHAVHASGDEFGFQLQSLGDASSLLVYQPSTKTVYVYKGAMSGNSALQCNFKFQLTTPGGVIRRQNCDVQSLIP